MQGHDDSSAPQAGGQAARVDVPGVGACVLPDEFAIFTGEIEAAEVHDARESPGALFDRLAADAALVLRGPYRYVDAVFRYCQRFARRLVAGKAFAHLADRGRRSAAFAAARRRKLHRLLLAARGETLVNVDDPPDTAGLQDWLQRPTGEAAFLIPVRRLQRILTDMRRARDGLQIACLGARLTLLPHVYVPADQSVPAMLCDLAHLIEGRRVLDMGTGTGVLALLAARLGAARVVATDNNPKAVANARLNAERLGLSQIVDVRGPGDLFEAVGDEVFDVIVFNAPWIEGPPRTLYDTALYDPGYRVIDAFLEGARRHLAPGGAVLLQYSNVSQRQGADSMTHLRAALADRGLEVASSRHIDRLSRLLGARERVFLLELRPREKE